MDTATITPTTKPAAAIRPIRKVTPDIRTRIYEIVDDAITEGKRHSVSVIGDQQFSPMMEVDGRGRLRVIDTTWISKRSSTSESRLTADAQRGIAAALAQDEVKREFKIEVYMAACASGGWSTVRGKMADEIAAAYIKKHVGK